MNGRKRVFRFIDQVMLFPNLMEWKIQEEKRIFLLICIKDFLPNLER